MGLATDVAHEKVMLAVLCRQRNKGAVQSNTSVANHDLFRMIPFSTASLVGTCAARHAQFSSFDDGAVIVTSAQDCQTMHAESDSKTTAPATTGLPRRTYLPNLGRGLAIPSKTQNILARLQMLGDAEIIVHCNIIRPNS